MKDKKKQSESDISPEEVTALQQQYEMALVNDPKFSLDVDPENKYGMSEEQKNFIRHYVQFKNIPIACQLCGISEAQGKAFYLSFNSQQEIRRINMAMYHRQFSTRLLTLDEIGGYLSSLLTDTNIAIADRLETKDKLKVAQMIIDLNELKRTALSDPTVIEAIDITDQMKDLSVKTIKQMLETANNPEISDSKDDIINRLTDENDLSVEEVTYLRSLPLEQLLDLLEKGNAE